MAFTYVTLTAGAGYRTATGATPPVRIRAKPLVEMTNGTVVVKDEVVIPLGSNGVATKPLAATTDPATTPAGNAYRFYVETPQGIERTFLAAVPHNAGATVDLGSLVELEEPPPLSEAGPWQPLDADLTALAGLGDGNPVRRGGVWTVVDEAPLSLLDPRVNCALDGTGDQASKVATAIGLLPSTGGHLYQPRGTLRTSAISFDRPVRWEGAGDQASTVQAAAGFTGTLMTITSSAPFSRISDVQLAGGGSATKLLLVASARVRLDHLHLTAQDGTAGAAIHFNGVSTSASAHAGQVESVRIVDCDGYGVWLQGFSYDNEFNNLWIGNCNVGIRYENTNGFFSNTHVWGCIGNGVELRDGNHLFSNCYVETNGGSGLNLFNAARVKLSNCNIWKNQGQGVSLSGTSHRFSVLGSQIYDNGGNGVQAADCLHGKVIGCDFYDDTASTQSQDRAVVTTGTSDKWIIASNTMLTAEHAVGGNSLVGANNVTANNVT